MRRRIYQAVAGYSVIPLRPPTPGHTTVKTRPSPVQLLLPSGYSAPLPICPAAPQPAHRTLHCLPDLVVQPGRRVQAQPHVNLGVHLQQQRGRRQQCQWSPAAGGFQTNKISGEGQAQQKQNHRRQSCVAPAAHLVDVLPAGARAACKLDVHVICGSHRNPDQLVSTLLSCVQFNLGWPHHNRPDWCAMPTKNTNERCIWQGPSRSA